MSTLTHERPGNPSDVDTLVAALNEVVVTSIARVALDAPDAALIDAERAEALARRTFAEGGQANARLLRRWVAPLRNSF